MEFVKDLEILEGPEESLIFSFPSVQCRDKILQQGPWNIKGSLLVLKPWDVNATLQEISFTTMRLWLQIHRLPLGLMTREIALEYGSKASLVQEIDFDLAKKVRGMAFLRVRVLMDLVKPLVVGCYLSRAQKQDVWVQFRYERISEWCLSCGRLDHIQRFCLFPPAEQIGP